MTIQHHEDERFACFLADNIHEIEAPSPPVPREEMWTRIVAQRHGHAWIDSDHAGVANVEETVNTTAAVSPASPSIVKVRSKHVISWGGRTLSVRWAIPLVAAVLLVGVGLGIHVGRQTPTVRQPQVAVASPSPMPVTQVANRQYIREVKLLLDRFDKAKASGSEVRVDAQTIQQARHLLAATQLLLNSPVGTDPQRRQLLTDIELALLQITGLAPTATTEDRDLVEQSIEHSGVVHRLEQAQ